MFSLEEWISDLGLCGVKCGMFFNIKSTLSFSEIVSLYDTLTKVILYTLDNLHTLLITADEKAGKPFLLLNLSCDCSLSDLSLPEVSICNEDIGEWIVRISTSRRCAA